LPEVDEVFSLSTATPEGSFAHGQAAFRGGLHAAFYAHRGIQMDAGGRAALEGHLGADLGKQVTASLGAGADAAVEIGFEAAIPFDLFREAGLVSRFQLEAEAAGYFQAQLALKLDELRDSMFERTLKGVKTRIRGCA
jgi:hypothetical protein